MTRCRGDWSRRKRWVVAEPASSDMENRCLIRGHMRGALGETKNWFLVEASRARPRARQRFGRPSRPTGSLPCLRPRMGGLDTLTKSLPRASPLARGLGKDPNLRLARGPTRTASNETAILRIARGWLDNNPSLPSQPVFSTVCHVPLMRQPLPQSQPDDGSTPQSGRRDNESHQRHTD